MVNGDRVAWRPLSSFSPLFGDFAVGFSLFVV